MRFPLHIGPEKDLLRLALFAGFVAFGVAATWRARTEGQSRRRIDRLLIYTLLVSLGVGLVQKESWPFTTWALVHNVSPQRIDRWDFFGFDASGREYPIDLRFLQPLAPEEFDTWQRKSFFALNNLERREVARDLLRRAEEARKRFLENGQVGTDGWLLRSAAAPHHFVRPPLWKTPADVPATPFVHLQIWKSEWNVEERFADERRVGRTLLYRDDG